MNTLRAIDAEHLFTQLLAQVAHVAFNAEGEVVVVAALAYPVACSFVGLFDLGVFYLLLSCFIKFKWRFHARFR